jgi:hypothetical protein
MCLLYETTFILVQKHPDDEWLQKTEIDRSLKPSAASKSTPLQRPVNKTAL